MPRGEKQKAQGIANTYAAVDLVRTWGGSLPLSAMRGRQLGRGAKRAVKMGLLVKNRTAFVLNEGVSNV
jgi:hypothetical protein